MLISMVWQPKKDIHSEALWCQSLGEATSTFLWTAVGAMWNNLVVLKIAFWKIRAACIYGIVRGCEMPALTTKCEQALLIVLAGMWFRPPDPSNQVYLFQGRLRAKQFFMFALVFFSIELRTSERVSATIILIFWQVQLLISSPLPISCFVFLFMGHTFQQATATPGILERLWSTECTPWRWLSGSWNDQEERLHHLKNVVTF